MSASPQLSGQPQREALRAADWTPLVERIQRLPVRRDTDVEVDAKRVHVLNHVFWVNRAAILFMFFHIAGPVEA